VSRVRCAIYTRKSSEEGLEQDFNSLHAQREACSAYVLSQASEGWTALAETYDDGGLSGGSLERPALQRVLADIAAGRVDIVVVYKVDRLTRSLLDFAKLVEAFDQAGVSFVSVTQSFNTTTSMGRLTLNMLLSFAQFEREVTAERIRDKIAASKARGMWMGGTPPLGYAPDGRSLVIVEEQAALVRMIYERYRELRNVRHVAEELQAKRILTPVRSTRTGRTFGGCAFSRGQLYAILRNPVYAGDIAHHGKVYPGNHPPIIDRASWNGVQAQLTENVRGTRSAREERASLLSGLLFDEAGGPLIAVHSRKGTRRYRYYVSRSAHHRDANSRRPSIRMPAHDIEQLVCSELAKLLGAPLNLLARCRIDVAPSQLATVLETCGTLAIGAGKRNRALVRALTERVAVHPDAVEIAMVPAALAELLELPRPANVTTLDHRIAVRLTRTGRALRLVDDSGSPAAEGTPDETLARLVVRARTWWATLEQTGQTVTELAASECVTASYLTRVLRLAFLSPDIVSAVVSGSMRAGIDASQLFCAGAISTDWTEQHRALLPQTAQDTARSNFNTSRWIRQSG
jgi:DNA invertase Pin-like site-specific DNA recombinase